METFINALLLFLPAGVANMAPVLANKVPGLNQWHTPMDFGRRFGGARIFGDHKTWRGFVSGVACGVLTGALVYQFHSFGYSFTTFLLLSFSISSGALLGDALKSFFKRRVNVAPGRSWFPFDQIDYILGGLLFLLPFGIPTLATTLTIFITYFALHLLSAYLGYLLRLKSTPI